MAAAILGVDIIEAYSPERVAKVAAKFGFRAGSSFYLSNGWDFNIVEHRRKAWSKIKDESPYLSIGSPPCTYFIVLQELNAAVHAHKPEWMAKVDEEKRKAKIHVEFPLSRARRAGGVLFRPAVALHWTRSLAYRQMVASLVKAHPFLA